MGGKKLNKIRKVFAIFLFSILILSIGVIIANTKEVEATGSDFIQFLSSHYYAYK
jgi:hypothetical protein